MLDILKRSLSILAVLSVVSCGGGGSDNYIVGVDNTAGAGSSTGSSSGTDTTDTTDTTGTSVDNRIADLEVAASSRQLGSNGSVPVIISAVVKDKNNNTLKDVDVQFSVDNNATIEPDEDGSTVAGPDGGAAVTTRGSVKTAKLTPGLNRPENRTLLVTVTAGSEVRTIEVEVVGTVVQVDGPERVVINTPTRFVIKLKDSTGAGLPYQVVDLQSANGNMIEVSGGQGFSTDTEGEVTFDFTASTSGSDVITATALGDTYKHSVSISGDEFALKSQNKEISVNSDEVINLVWKQNGVAQVNKTINLTATRGVVPTTAVTNSNGEASFSITSSTAGGTVIMALDASSGLTASLVREFVAIVPEYITVQAEQTNIGPEERTTITAQVRDINDNPVKNQTVNFVHSDTVDGELSNPSATTDSLGRASVVYIAGNSVSAKDGVVITATLQSNPLKNDQLNLTVGGRALRIVLGSDEKLVEEGVFYKKGFGVVVTDSAGNPVAGKVVDFSLIPTHYYKGAYFCDQEAGKAVQAVAAMCESEDLDNDGKLDHYEDHNGSLALEPTHTATVNSKVITDEDGKATVMVIYPQSEAEWSKVRLIASISDEGSEYHERTEFILPVLASDVSSCEITPPNEFSHYGLDSSCESPY